MDFETIVALADQKEIKVIKDIIKTLSEKIDHLVVTPLRIGKLGDETVVTFKVDKPHFKFLIEKMTFNNIRILSNDQKVRQVIDSAKAKPAPTVPVESKGWDDIKERPRGLQENLEDCIRDGNYEEVIKISRNIAYGQEVVEKAKKSITETVNIAIEKNYNEAITRKYETGKCVERLIKIASDNNLKMLQKIDLIKQAGINAVDACAINPDYVGELIKMANNTSLHNLVNFKAAVKFAEVVLPEQEKFKQEIDIAVRNLNIRWLSLALDVVMNELESNEITLFENLVSFIKEKRQS